MRRRLYHLAAVVAFLGAALAGAFVIGALVPEQTIVLASKTKPAPAAVPAKCDRPVGLDGIEAAAATAAIFVDTTVVSDGDRVAPECSYTLVTRKLRRNLTPREWAAGNIPVVPFVVDDLKSVQSFIPPESILIRGRDSIDRECNFQSSPPDTCFPYEVDVTIVLGGDLGNEFVIQPYEIHVVKTPAGWRVDYWMPIVAPSAPAQDGSR